METDVRLVSLTEREGEAMGVKAMIGTVLAVVVLLMIGLYVYVKLGASTSPIGSDGVYANNTYYCTSDGVANLTDNTCLTGTRTAFTANTLANYNTWLGVKANARAGFDLSSIIPIVLAATAIIGLLYMAFS